ncbi:hypothetical protein ACFW9M_04890 [Streptomyces lydicus]|uniref:hypothetical protein n=1 Tax=Streptomyces lydicus TaxID=47763 RepID=UPI0036A81D7B
MRVLTNELVDLAVLSEGLAEASWEEITEALNRWDAGSVQAEYEDGVGEWWAAPAETVDGIGGDVRDLDAGLPGSPRGG